MAVFTTHSIASVSNPDLCVKVKVRQKPNLKFTCKLSKGAVIFDKLGREFISNGRIRLKLHKSLDSKGSPRITMAGLKKIIFENTAYFHVDQ